MADSIMDGDNAARPLPSATYSNAKIKKDAAKAWFTLKTMKAEDVLDILGLSAFCKGDRMAQTIGELYLDSRGGDVKAYHLHLTAGQRVGQAFFNALSNKDRDRLRGHILDPFNARSAQAVERAVTFLLDTEED